LAIRKIYDILKTMAKCWTIKEENQKRKELVKLYINQNKTIGEIGKILGIAEQTVYDRIIRLGIPVTPERKPHYLNKKRGELNFPDFSEKLAEFAGIMLGDGHIGPGQIRISFNSITDEEYVIYAKKLLKFLFKVEPGLCQRKKENAVELFISSVDLIDYLRKKGLSVANKVKYQVDAPSWIFTKDSYKKYFLRGFFDTDGSIYRLKFGVQMCFCNRSLPLLYSARKILIELKYHPPNISGYNFYLTRKSDLFRYITEIGFGNLKHFRRAKNFGAIQ
jgi:intein/homing endonuclease